MANLSEQAEYDGFLERFGQQNENLYRKLAEAMPNPGIEIPFSRRVGQSALEPVLAIVLLIVGIPFVAGFLYQLPETMMSPALGPAEAIATAAGALYIILLAWLAARRIRARRLENMMLSVSAEKGVVFLALIDHRGRTRATSYYDMHPVERVWLEETRRFGPRWRIMLSDTTFGRSARTRALPLPGLGRWVGGYRHIGDKALKFIRANFPTAAGVMHM